MSVTGREQRRPLIDYSAVVGAFFVGATHPPRTAPRKNAARTSIGRVGLFGCRHDAELLE